MVWQSQNAPLWLILTVMLVGVHFLCGPVVLVPLSSALEALIKGKAQI